MKHKNTFVRWLCLLLLIAAVIGVTVVSAAPKAAPDGLVLEDMPIVLPANATDVEKTAAKELQHYLKEITGSSSAFLTEGITLDHAIYLGDTKFAEEHNVTYTDNNGNGEGWAIKAVGNNLVLTGGCTRGTLYAVYHLLEDELGVRWWNMWEEYVPAMEDAVIPFDFESSDEPLFGDRGIYSDETSVSLFYTRNRMNGWTSNGPQAYGGEENYALPYHVHNFNRYFPAFYEKPTNPNDTWTEAINPEGVDWFVEHPDWYAYSEIRGERISFGQMCLSNDEFIEIFVEKILIAIDMSYEQADKAGKARPKYVDVSPNDLGGLCACELCKASTAASGESGHLLKFVNKIAAGIQKVYPEILVETLAYSEYFEVPLDDTVPADNVIIRLASSDVDVVHDIDHPTNVKVKDRLYKWGELLKPGQMIYWDYAIIYDSNGVVPNWFKWFNDYRQVYEAGGYGVFAEVQNINTSDFWDLKHWILCKLMENPYLDQYELTMDFCTGYYGEAAAQHIYDYLVFAEERASHDMTIRTFADSVIEAPWLSAKDVLQSNQYFEDAIAALKADSSLSKKDRELFINRVNAARGGLDRLILTNYLDYVDEMAALKDPNQLFLLNIQEVGQRMLDSVDWLCKMEFEYDHTGMEGFGVRGLYGGTDMSSYYERYAAETDSLGNLMERPAVPAQIYEDHPGVSENHIYQYTSANLFHSGIYISSPHISKKENAASWEGGTALEFDYAKLYAFEEMFGSDGSSATFSETRKFPTSLGEWYLGDPLIADGEYHLYRAEDVVILSEGKSVVSFFHDEIRTEVSTLEQLTDIPVDVYVSMKIVGDPSGKDPRNYAKVYLDQMIIVEPCGAYEMDVVSYTEATCAENAYYTGTCSACGQMGISEVYNTKLNHTIDSYSYDAATKTYVGNCSECGEQRYKFLGELPENVLDYLVENHIDFASVHDYGIDRFVTHEMYYDYTDVLPDADSALGKSVVYYLDRMVEHERTLYFEITDEKPLLIGGDKVRDGLYANEILQDGEYHAYQLDNVPLVRSSEDNRLDFFDGSLRISFDDLEYLMGERVTVFFSMKIKGKLDFSKGAKLPEYYVDRIIVVENCKSHSAGEYVYNGEKGLYEGTCVNCGMTISYKFERELPQEILDAVKEKDTDLSHVYEYDVSDFYHDEEIYSYQGVAKDPASVMEQSFWLDSAQMGAGLRDSLCIFNDGKPLVITARTVYGDLTEAGMVQAADMNANSGDGKYHLYKATGVLTPEDHHYSYFFDGAVYSTFKDIQDVLADKMVDIYLSMRIEGDVTGIKSQALPKYYLDRIIVLDNCTNHMKENQKEIISEATCYQGTIVRGICGFCGKISTTEQPSKLKAHRYGDYVMGEDGVTMVAACRNDGCTAVKTINTASNLPQDLIDAVEASGSDLAHVRAYDTADFFHEESAAHMGIVTDSGSTVGEALRIHTGLMGAGMRESLFMFHEDKPLTFTSVVNGKHQTFGSITAGEMKANSNDGEYHLYKISGKLLLEGHSYTYCCDGYVTAFFSEVKDDLADKQIDFYLSMKIDGDVTCVDEEQLPVYYLDQMFIVDSCDNYEITYEDNGGGSCTSGSSLIGYCPVCGNERVKEGSSAGHKFTTYYRDTLDDTLYIAECDYGCGATDTKIYNGLSLDDKLPDTMSDSVKQHVIWSYTCDEFHLSGEEKLRPYRWDLDLDRPVAIRDYRNANNEMTQVSLNMTRCGDILCAMYGFPGDVLGGFSGDEVIANAGDGQYHLYSLKGVVPVKDGISYRYMYIFNDWVMQVESLDDELQRLGYEDKLVDLYLHMKVEGDPTCGGKDKPVYYIDQLIVATSCETDETWTVTKEATCTEKGEMVGDCKVCGLQGSVVEIPMLDHVVEYGIRVSEPTCKLNERVYGNCSVCGERVKEAEVPGTMLKHSFTNYVKQNDGSGREIAYCDNGCGERHERGINGTVTEPEIPEQLQQILPVLGSDNSFSFSDVKVSDWYYDVVKEAWENGLVNGVTANEFRPNETLTVAQAVKLASAFHEKWFTGSVNLENGTGNWYSSYVGYAVDNGIINCKYASYGTAQMNKAINRSEFVSIFAKAMDDASLVGYNTVSDNAIPDVKMSDANADAIYKFYRAGILTGSDGKGTFKPDSSIKRSEVAAILSRMYNEGTRQSITLK